MAVAAACRGSEGVLAGTAERDLVPRLEAAAEPRDWMVDREATVAARAAAGRAVLAVTAAAIWGETASGADHPASPARQGRGVRVAGEEEVVVARWQATARSTAAPGVAAAPAVVAVAAALAVRVVEARSHSSSY
jgi:hypothetical protein